MNRSLYAAITLVATIALLIACGQKSPQRFGITAPVPANGVYIVDGTGATPNVYNGSNPMPVTIGGSSDAGGIVQVDPIAAAISLNQAVVQNVAATQGVLIDGGTHYIINETFTNQGATTCYAQTYCGMTVPDAGGLADSGLVPVIEIACPAKTICGMPYDKSPILCDGGIWQSSSTQGFVTVDAGTCNFTLTGASIR
jgi:hypothetical protein